MARNINPADYDKAATALIRDDLTTLHGMDAATVVAAAREIEFDREGSDLTQKVIELYG